ncbi:MAG: M3 family oligoendopeptidase [Polyangiaceae bacterium]|nr:M3 family oligoendopeptidase [Polyangiaceae bacterium]
MNAPLMNWDLSPFFPTFDGPEHRAFLADLARDVTELTAEAARLAVLGPDTESAWASVLERYEGIGARLSHVWSYTHALGSCDAANEAYRREAGKLSVLGAEVQKLGVELQRAVRGATDADIASLAGRPELAGASFFITRLRDEALLSMEPALEGLAADLGTDGIHAWGRLYDTVSGTLTFEMAWPDGRRETLGMSQRRSLTSNPDRAVREAAFRGGNEAWQGVADVAAAALNAIAGTRHSLYRRRGVPHFLDAALFDAAISRKTLDAMFEAVEANAEVARRFLRLKARAFGQEEVCWYDLEAPLPVKTESTVTWEGARSMVRGAFQRAYPSLAGFFDQVLDKRWVEWEPRAGKQPGAYCTSSPLINESRVFMTFQGALGDVSTLAHEVGHAFHNWVMRDLRGMSRHYPMTLAESASTFAELVLSDGLLSDPSIGDETRAVLLAEQLGDSTAFLLDIPVRFQFEKALYERRAKEEVGASELCELMASTQRRIFGDTLRPGGEDPLFWASKLHFYISSVSFYNFPYTFGYLLSRGLYAQFKEQGASFLPRYEELLRLTGSGLAHDVAKTALGRDLEAPEFWAESIRSLEAPLAELEQLLPKIGLGPGQR